MCWHLFIVTHEKAEIHSIIQIKYLYLKEFKQLCPFCIWTKEEEPTFDKKIIKKKLPMLLLVWDSENKKERQKWRWILVAPLLLTKHCLQCVSVSRSAMAWSSGQLTLKLWALGCKGPNGGAGQLLSSAVISCRVYALELTNGLARRLLDAPLKQTHSSSTYVCMRVWVQKWPQDSLRQNIAHKCKSVTSSRATNESFF